MLLQSIIVLIMFITCSYSNPCVPTLPNDAITLTYAGVVPFLPDGFDCTETDDEIDAKLDNACNTSFPGSRNIRGVELENGGFQNIGNLPAKPAFAFTPSCECGQGCGDTCAITEGARLCAFSDPGWNVDNDTGWVSKTGTVLSSECVYAETPTSDPTPEPTTRPTTPCDSSSISDSDSDIDSGCDSISIDSASSSSDHDSMDDSDSVSIGGVISYTSDSMDNGDVLFVDKQNDLLNVDGKTNDNIHNTLISLLLVTGCVLLVILSIANVALCYWCTKNKTTKLLFMQEVHETSDFDSL